MLQNQKQSDDKPHTSDAILNSDETRYETTVETSPHILIICGGSGPALGVFRLQPYYVEGNDGLEEAFGLKLFNRFQFRDVLDIY